MFALLLFYIRPSQKKSLKRPGREKQWVLKRSPGAEPLEQQAQGLGPRKGSRRAGKRPEC
jgi:hypothetical protein